MRILFLTGGLILLAATPVAAQEASDSTRVFAVPASTPAAPTLQVILDQSVAAVAGLASDSATPDAAAAMLGAALAGAVVLLSLRHRGGIGSGGCGPGVLRF